jgi:hypothetical protein
MNVRVMDVESGQVVYASEAIGRTTEEITGKTRELADRVARNMR